ncbi:xylan 1,4-beta-xylosidase [Micromonospora sp. DR5-3]|uniref:GH39 family glycosyl hydrolase n=1 Tax=unclassified Micromonospora TaxID=2617518 RepID=UPI0011D31020|nr:MULTISPECIES: xylan 1,4-beta-xylosidase [unclassified Micromonospora]MCW3814031.1 xylan 1,4-beta-xylosidase [Micromonospora sp. DR5-3]TYC23616.1 xylan 1,4-beta-xylosidase [Micromonospora sp. MP36]
MTRATGTPPGNDARSDWAARISRRSDESRRPGTPDLPPPAGLRAEPGVGHVRLSWQPVDGAVGYLVHRAPAGDASAFAPVDHLGGDVLAVPDPWYVDTTGEPGHEYAYAVAAVPEVTVTGALSAPVTAAALPAVGAPPTVRVRVDAGAAGVPLHCPWQPMIGSERLSQLLCPDLTGGREIGTELLAALRRVRDEIGVETVRAHSILHDDLGVYREVDGEPRHDFSRVDETYDLLLSTGLRPVVEIGFMPRDLARDPERTVFEYRGIISPPKDWDRWADLVRALVRHLLDRYGEEVLGWDFEVWNEANLEVFWSGTRAEWMRLYDVTAQAVKDVDPRIPVGGPSSAAAGWVDTLLEHASISGVPVDFVSTHTYGSPPLDLRPTLRRFGRPDARILWTEWGVTPTHFHPVNDGVFAATFLLTGMRSAAGRVDALSYWVASDHFEELGRPPRLLHGGFGLITVGGIAKPRYHALWLLSRLGETELPVRASGDGADGLVQTWASRRDDGSLAVLVWASTLDQSKRDGDPALARRVALTIDGVAGQVRVTRLDREHGDVTTLAARLGVAEWPDEEQWAALRAVDTLRAEPVDAVNRDGNTVLELDLPQPGAVLVEVGPPR